MSYRLLPFSACLVAVSCSSAEDVRDDLGVSMEAKSAQADAVVTTQPAGARSVEVKNDDYSFSYAYPAAAGGIGALRAELDRRLEAAQAELASEATEARRDAQVNDYPYRAYSFGEEWKVVADIPGWLSLSSEISTYTGGAHGNSGFDSLLWDKSARTVRKPIDLFRSPGALRQSISRRFCEALNEQRTRRRGSPVEADSEDIFDICPDIDELTVLLGSSGGRKFDRIGLLAAPYVAGAYAEGSYEITLPVTTSVIDAVKPEYARAFRLKR